jgi:predicted phage tail protein
MFAVHDRAMRTNAYSQLQPRVIQLTRRTVFMITSGAAALAGAVFSTAAFASGVQSLDVLAIVFFLGVSGTLLALVVFYMTQLKPR